MPRRKPKKPDPKLRSPWLTNQGQHHLSGSNITGSSTSKCHGTDPPVESLSSQTVEVVVLERAARREDCLLIDLPKEIQVRILTYLRANCLARLQQTCSWFNSPELVHSIVGHASEYVYPPEMTAGFEKQPVSTSASLVSTNKNGKKQLHDDRKEDKHDYFTFEHLRNMELLVIARVLSSPEPSVGFVVSRSWCKTALKWLEEQQEVRLYRCSNADCDKKKAKGLKKAHRLQQKRTNETVKLCPNVNFDITCPHDQLQHLSSSKSARSRRRLLDKKAWKILNALYPESTPLESVYGECVQCRLEAEMVRKDEVDQKENEKARRKVPLANVDLRRFYTRTRGVPEHCLRTMIKQASVQDSDCSVLTGAVQSTATIDDEDYQKFPAVVGTHNSCAHDFAKKSAFCPLVNGSYYILPRSWCHGWRRYMKTGEVGQQGCNLVQKGYSSINRNSCEYPPPDAAVLLCDAHSMALLPPHLESYLFDDIRIVKDEFHCESKQLMRSLATTGHGQSESHSAAVLPTQPSTVLVGERPMHDTVDALRAAGLSDHEVHIQLSAMRALEEQRRRSIDEDDNENDGSYPTSRSRSNSFGQNEVPASRPRSGSFGQNELLSPLPCRARSGSLSNSELLDRENHAVVEILTRDEYRALERCWPGTTLFALRFTVSDASRDVRNGVMSSSVDFNTPVCRECDATGRRCSVVIKNRSRGWLKKSSDKARAPASLEY